MSILTEIQKENKEWVQHNFPANTQLWEPTLGVAEEAGELAHAVLKLHQSIRGTKDEHIEAITDAVGDISIYLIDLCNKLGIDFEQAIYETWQTVRLRDWIKYPKDGRTE